MSVLLCVVDFHHARGPEIERWVGAPPGTDPAIDNDWDLLPFQALSDGAHLFAEDFSYFTLVAKQPTPTSLFGISCTRQIDASTLLYKSADVTRSAVQKAVVVVTSNPQSLSAIREKLSIVTRAWFDQKDFRDYELLENFQASLAAGVDEHENESDNLFGLSLREIVHVYKWQTLVLFKALLLQPKLLFFGTHCEKICQIQFALLSLVPGLLKALQDCADPTMDSYGATLTKSTSLKTSDRSSLLRYMGCPLQIFGKGSLFGPYTPLQQLDILADRHTKSYVVGSTNALLLHQKDKYADILVNLDESSVNIYSASLRSALVLSVADRRWADFITQSVNDTWDPQNPTRPTTLAYAGSEEFLRTQFEEYLLALLSSIKYHDYAFSASSRPQKALLNDVEGDPITEFNADFVSAWTTTENHALFQRVTDSHIFDVIEPRHPCAGGLTIEDVQRRLTAQVSELHLDERWRGGKQIVGRHFAEGQKRLGGFIGGVWADVEALREAQRKKSAESGGSGSGGSSKPLHVRTGSDGAGGTKKQQQPPSRSATALASTSGDSTAGQGQGQGQQGGYLSSWSAWAAEKRRAGWGGGAVASSTSKSQEPSSPERRSSEMRQVHPRSSSSAAVVELKSPVAASMPSLTAASVPEPSTAGPAPADAGGEGVSGGVDLHYARPAAVRPGNKSVAERAAEAVRKASGDGGLGSPVDDQDEAGSSALGPPGTG